MLIIVKHRDVHLLLQRLFDDEAFRCLDILEVDTAEGRAKEADGVDEGVRIFGIHFQIDGIHVCEPFEENRFALHDRFRAQRAEVSETENRGPVRNHRDEVAFARVVIGCLWVLRDFLAGDRDPRRIGKAEVPLRGHGDGRLHFPLAGRGFEVERKCVFPGYALLRHSWASLGRPS